MIDDSLNVNRGDIFSADGAGFFYEIINDNSV